jgi:Cu+-exporting ATPase
MGEGQARVIDPVCGMTVQPATAPASHIYQGHTYYFCNPGCRQKFLANPEKYLQGGPSALMASHPQGENSSRQAAAGGGGVEYTCPMHPEVVSNKPGACPKCGMALEPRTVTAEEGPNPELADMSRRF